MQRMDRQPTKGASQVNILAIDPGPDESAWCIYDGCKPREWAKQENAEVLHRLGGFRDADILVIEQVAAMGMSVGAEVFETVFWSGRFAEAWGARWDRIKRHEIKMHLCGNTRAKDGNVRTAIIDRYGPGKEKAIGRKKTPGPLYGMAGDCWQALAVAITYHETRMEKT
jgi:hypothetical protein